ncbi:glutamate receptor ionotropic, kainate 2-like [Euwallacea fornicatus]|uniref:glutamate receptor ionotropic, kainate 2-like n=1 Tax=Euwallacea fornicatus TaxID=995702 RepID=UPI00338F4A47
MKIVFQNLIVIFSFVAYNYFCLAKDNIKIGLFFNENQMHDLFNWEIIQDQAHPEIEFEASKPIVVPETDSFEIKKIACAAFSSENGYSAVFGPRHLISSGTIQSACSNFAVPCISTQWIPMNTQLNPYTLNVYPDANFLSQGLAMIVKSLDWDRFVIVYENEDSLTKLQDVLKLQLYQDESDSNSVLIKQLGTGPDYRPLLKDISTLHPQRLILDCNVDKITEILIQAKEVKLLDDFSTRIFLTSLDAHTINFKELKIVTNITAIRLFDPAQESVRSITRIYYPKISPEKLRLEMALQHDAELLLVKAMNSLKEKYPNTDLSSQRKYCNTSEIYKDLFNLVGEMQEVTVPEGEGLTGEFRLENGKRELFTLELIEVNNPDNPKSPIGIWRSDNPESIHLTRNATERERELQVRMQNYNFIVSSKLGKPYLMYSRIEGAMGNARFRGFSMDIITEVAKEMKINFTFELADRNLATSIVDDLVNRRADMGICDFTITQQRSEQIDFSLPFMSLGISILHSEIEQEEIDNMYGFMRPFSWTVWIYIITLYLVISFAILLIARLDPADWENPHPCNPKPEEIENIWGIKNCLWLTLGSIMTQGCDILPKGICSRIAAAMWWFFSLIMTSTYTANLAAFLTMSKKDESIKSVEDLANQNKIKYGVMSNGSTQTFFENSNNSLYQKMWATMKNENPSVFESSNDKGVERVLNTKKGLYAFFMESPQIEYELERHCGLKKIGQFLDSKSYGIGVPLGAEYRHTINAAILKLQENGRLNELKEKWWKHEDLEDKQCSGGGGEVMKDELTLANVGGAFIVLAAGIGFAFILAFIEFLWNVHNISVEEHISYFEALKCEIKFACNIRVTKKAAKPVISDSSSSKSESGRSMARTVLAGAGSFLNINASVLNRLAQDRNFTPEYISDNH